MGARVMEHSAAVQIEYEFSPASDHSKKLEAMYAKRGYEVFLTIPPGEVTDKDLRLCYKTFTQEEQRRGQKKRLLAEHMQITALLAQLPVLSFWMHAVTCCYA